MMFHMVCWVVRVSLAREVVAKGAPGMSCTNYFVEHAAHQPDPPIVYIAFDKTGSTSLQHTLLEFMDLDYQWPRSSCPPQRWPRVWYSWAQYAEFGVPSVPRVKYLTLLRDPVGRLRAAYLYFCVDCREGGRQCGREGKDVLK